MACEVPFLGDCEEGPQWEDDTSVEAERGKERKRAGEFGLDVLNLQYLVDSHVEMSGGQSGIQVWGRGQNPKKLTETDKPSPKCQSAWQLIFFNVHWLN